MVALGRFEMVEGEAERLAALGGVQK